MLLEILVLFLLLILLFSLIMMGRKKKTPSSSGWDSIQETEEPVMQLCPLCKSSLYRGEKVYSHLFPGKPDQMMHIFGCPHCYIKEGSGRTLQMRLCPYCQSPLDAEDYVIARVFSKPGKTQVHVLGCTRCRITNPR